VDSTLGEMHPWDPMVQPECKTTDCWYASMGSGQSLADPYLALMRRSVWQDGQPNIEEATFAAY